MVIICAPEATITGEGGSPKQGLGASVIWPLSRKDLVGPMEWLWCFWTAMATS